MEKDIDTVNEFLVASTQGGLVIMNPPRGRITSDQAIRLAAYLVVMSEYDFASAKKTEPTFEEVLEAVKNT